MDFYERAPVEQRASSSFTGKVIGAHKQQKRIVVVSLRPETKMRRFGPAQWCFRRPLTEQFESW